MLDIFRSRILLINDSPFSLILVVELLERDFYLISFEKGPIATLISSNYEIASLGADHYFYLVSSSLSSS